MAPAAAVPACPISRAAAFGSPAWAAIPDSTHSIGQHSANMAIQASSRTPDRSPGQAIWVARSIPDPVRDRPSTSARPNTCSVFSVSIIGDPPDVADAGGPRLARRCLRRPPPPGRRPRRCFPSPGRGAARGSSGTAPALAGRHAAQHDHHGGHALDAEQPEQARVDGDARVMRRRAGRRSASRSRAGCPPRRRA